MSRQKFDWDAWKAQIQTYESIWEPLREYMQVHFMEASELKLKENEMPGYIRRPTIGLRLLIEDDTGLVVRPGWSPPRHRHDPACFGELKPHIIHLELLHGPKKLFGAKLKEGEPVHPTYTLWDQEQREKALKVVLDMAHELLTDPMGLFSQQSDRCCCCYKELTDDVSRTRGVGPDCFRYFNCFAKEAKVPDLVQKYRDKYLKETGFYPGK